MWQVTARGGQPTLICEAGDTETQALSGGSCIEIPHTVDCLQVRIWLQYNLRKNLREDFTITENLLNNSFLNVRALVGAFNQEKALVGAFSVLTNFRIAFF